MVPRSLAVWGVDLFQIITLFLINALGPPPPPPPPPPRSKPFQKMGLHRLGWIVYASFYIFACSGASIFSIRSTRRCGVTSPSQCWKHLFPSGHVEDWNRMSKMYRNDGSVSTFTGFLHQNLHFLNGVCVFKNNDVGVVLDVNDTRNPQKKSMRIKKITITHCMLKISELTSTQVARLVIK